MIPKYSSSYISPNLSDIIQCDNLITEQAGLNMLELAQPN